MLSLLAFLSEEQAIRVISLKNVKGFLVVLALNRLLLISPFMQDHYWTYMKANIELFM